MALLSPPLSVRRRGPVDPFGVDDTQADAFTALPSAQQSLPVPPPSVIKKSPTIWDKEHAPETLARISQAFLSNQNFGEGLGAAAGVMADRMSGIRDETKKAISYGGPNGQFEIATDRNGNRTIREVPEFANAVKAERDAKAQAALDARTALSGKDMRDAQARLVYQINQLPKEQRPAAYADLMQNAKGYGVDTAGMPPMWNDTYGAIMGNSGQTIVQDRKGDRDDLLAGWKMADGDKRTAQGAERLELAKGKDARAALKGLAPPSVRSGGKPRSGTLKSGQSMGGYTFMGGDPSNQSNWKKQ